MYVQMNTEQTPGKTSAKNTQNVVSSKALEIAWGNNSRTTNTACVAWLLLQSMRNI